MKRLKEVYDLYKDSLSQFSDRDDNVLIIDGTNSFIRVFANNPSTNDDGEHIGGLLGFLRSIASNIRQFNATRCVVVFDGKGGSSRRRKLYPQYKGDRAGGGRLNRSNVFEGLVDEQQSLKFQFKRLFEYLDKLPLTVIVLDNIEADDVVGYITKQYYDEKSKVTIVSTDRDFLQLVNENIKVWSPIKKKLYTPEKITEELGIHPDNYLLYRIINGDTSDNIPGVKGIGLKSLIKCIPQLKDEQLDINTIQEIVKDNIDNKQKIYQKLFEGFDIMQLNYQLMQLQETNISANSKESIMRLMDNPINKIQLRDIMNMVIEDKMETNIKNFNEWINKSFSRLNSYAQGK